MQGMCPEQQQHKAKAEACVKVSVGEKTKGFAGKSVKVHVVEVVNIQLIDMR